MIHPKIKTNEAYPSGHGPRQQTGHSASEECLRPSRPGPEGYRAVLLPESNSAGNVGLVLRGRSLEPR